MTGRLAGVKIRDISTPGMRPVKQKRKTYANLFIDSDPEAPHLTYINQTPPKGGLPLTSNKKNRYNGYSDGRETSNLFMSSYRRQ